MLHETISEKLDSSNGGFNISALTFSPSALRFYYLYIDVVDIIKKRS